MTYTWHTQDIHKNTYVRTARQATRYWEVKHGVRTCADPDTMLLTLHTTWTVHCSYCIICIWLLRQLHCIEWWQWRGMCVISHITHYMYVQYIAVITRLRELQVNTIQGRGRVTVFCFLSLAVVYNCRLVQVCHSSRRNLALKLHFKIRKVLCSIKSRWY